MVKSEQKRQQKLARKQAKDRKRHQQEAVKRQQLSSLRGQMLSACHGKIETCAISTSMREGLGQVLLARRAGPGQLAFMAVLVDSYCLGVKNAMGGIASDSEIKEKFERLEFEHVDPSLALGLVQTAIEFAAQAGLHPHSDYARVAPLWGDIQRGSIEGHYEMGRDGKHIFIAGPYDDEARQLAIITTMNTHLGGENEVFGDERAFDGDEVAFDVDDFEDAPLDATSYRRIDVPEA